MVFSWQLCFHEWYFNPVVLLSPIVEWYFERHRSRPFQLVEASALPAGNPCIHNSICAPNPRPTGVEWAERTKPRQDKWVHVWAGRVPLPVRREAQRARLTFTDFDFFEVIICWKESLYSKCFVLINLQCIILYFTHIFFNKLRVRVHTSKSYVLQYACVNLMYTRTGETRQCNYIKISLSVSLIRVNL